MGRAKSLDIRSGTDEDKHRHYEEVDALYRQGKEVRLKEHSSGFPAVTVDCEDIHLLTDCLSLEVWWATFGKQKKEMERG